MSEALHLVGVLGNVLWAIGAVVVVVLVLAGPWLYRWLKPVVYRHIKAWVMTVAKDAVQDLATNHRLLERRVQTLEAAQAKHLELITQLIELQSPERRKEMERTAILDELGRETAPETESILNKFRPPDIAGFHA
jgi:hypothetical protein